MIKKMLVLSAIILLAVSGAVSQTTAQSSGDPSSSHATPEASQDRKLHADSPALRGNTQRSAADILPDNIEFICIRNPYIDAQFNIWIVNDVRGGIEELECKDRADLLFSVNSAHAQVFEINDVFETAKSRGRVALWLITPIIAKVLRDVEFHPEINKFSVNSYRIVRFDVVAVELNNDSWAIGQFDKTISKAAFSLAADKTLFDSADDSRGVRHRTETLDEYVYLNLTDLHEAGKSALEPFTDSKALEFVRTSVRSGNYHEYQRIRVSEPLVGVLNQLFEVEPSIDEMNSVVRIQSCKGKGGRGGTGFYVEESLLANDEADSARTKSESSLILTNYHVVKCAREGRIVFSSLELEHREKISRSSYGLRELKDLANLYGLSFEDLKEAHDRWAVGVVIYYDERRDLALVRAQRPAQPLKLYNDPTEVMVGDEVFALGHPRDLGYYMTKGIISRLITNCSSYLHHGKSYKERAPFKERVPLRCIQTDAAINPGNSGGPLLSANEKRVLGVNTAVIGWPANEELTFVHPGLATAIHYDEVRMFLREAGVPDPS